MALLAAILLESSLKWTPSAIPMDSSSLHYDYKSAWPPTNVYSGSTVFTHAPPGRGEQFVPPVFYDWRDGFPQCATEAAVKICRLEDTWACSAVSVLEDRLCMEAVDGNHTTVALSIPFLQTCVDVASKFSIMRLWDWLLTNGVATTDCIGNQFTGTSCPTTCADGYALRTKRIKAFYNVGHRDPHRIKEALITEGPVATEFALYEDFLYYSSGIYHHVAGKLLGYMSTVIVGYGIESDTDYWILRGSWGPAWGENGYFRHVQQSGNIDDNVLSFRL